MAAASPAGIGELRQITEAMLKAAQGGDWQAVSAYEEQRQLLVQSCSLEQAESGERLADELKRLLEDNARIADLAVQERERLAEEYRLSKSQERAGQTYRDMDIESNRA
jgi:hypothetical protein